MGNLSLVRCAEDAPPLGITLSGSRDPVWSDPDTIEVEFVPAERIDRGRF